MSAAQCSVSSILTWWRRDRVINFVLRGGASGTQVSKRKQLGQPMKLRVK